MPTAVADQLDVLAHDVAVLFQNLHRDWHEKGVSKLGIFLDSDPFHSLDKHCHVALALAQCCQGPGQVAGHSLRGGFQLRNA